MILLLVRSRLRADRWQLVGWVLGLAVTTLLVTVQIATTFPTGEARAATLHVLLATPVVLVFRGTPDGASAEAFMTALSLTFVAFLVGMMNVFLVTRHSRAVEDSGLGDTLGSTTAARTGPVVSVLLLVVAWNAIAGVAVASGPALAGDPPGGSMLFGAACASTGSGTAGVVLLLAQFFSSGRATNAAGAIILVAWYFLRGIGDATGTANLRTLVLRPSWVSWASPIGWAQATRPFGEESLWPLVLGPALLVAAGVGAFATAGRRDVGSASIGHRPGRADARRWLRGTIGLAVRLDRAVLLTWTIAVLAFSVLVGSLSGVVAEQLASVSPAVTRTITAMGGGAQDVSESFVRLGAGIIGVLVSAMSVQGALRLRREEASARADLLIVNGASRTAWFLAFAALPGAVAAVVLVLSGLVAAVAAGEVGGSSAPWATATLGQLPAVLVMLAVSALVVAIVPRTSVGLAWSLYAAAAFVGEYGSIADLPKWLRRLSPFEHVVDPFHVGPSVPAAVGMTAGALVVVGISALGMRFRDTDPDH